jgi:hypothetical protein
MKNLPKAMSNMFGANGRVSGNSPTFKITMKEYEEMAIRVGDKVGIEINKVGSSGMGFKDHLLCYFTSVSAHVSQYFSMSIAPSTSNNASLVALLPHFRQNFDFPSASTSGFSEEKVFSILLFHPCTDTNCDC